jgi:hypothetical protein
MGPERPERTSMGNAALVDELIDDIYATEVVSEEDGGITPENMPDAEPANMPDAQPENMPDVTPENMPDAQPGNMPDAQPENMPD